MHAGGAKLTDGRKRALFHAAVNFKKKFGAGWEASVDTYNQQMLSPPLPSEEVVGVQKSLRKKDYEYTCKKEPMCHHCKVDICRTRRYGVGEAVVDELTVVTSDPPRFRVRKGNVQFAMSLETILYYKSFKQAHFQHVGQVPRNMGQPAWEAYLNELMRGPRPRSRHRALASPSSFSRTSSSFSRTGARLSAARPAGRQAVARRGNRSLLLRDEGPSQILPDQQAAAVRQRGLTTRSPSAFAFSAARTRARPSWASRSPAGGCRPRASRSSCRANCRHRRRSTSDAAKFA